MNPLSSRLSLVYQKNQHFIESLVFRRAPEFVYQSRCDSLEGCIPVFTFHGVLPETFELQCQFLYENGYRSLSAHEFLLVLKSSRPLPKKSVLLTFDDGLKHIWTVAFPLLKKYKLQATCFLIPGCIPIEDRRIRPNLESVWKGEASLDGILDMASPGEALATWEEIKIMHESGIMDFQSHTMYHGLVFSSKRIFDFVHPQYDPYFYGNINIPIYQTAGKDIVSRQPVWGMPIYCGKPRMQAESRYFDDEAIRANCVEFVEKNGGTRFFEDKHWRKRLLKLVNDKNSLLSRNDRRETPEERDRAVFEELALSKRTIEEQLPGKEVVHLCYPWYDAESFAVRISQDAGFKANYFGQKKDQRSNKPGSDPLNIVRIDEIYLRRLPGVGRQSIGDVIKYFLELREFPVRVGLKLPKKH